MPMEAASSGDGSKTNRSVGKHTSGDDDDDDSDDDPKTPSKDKIDDVDDDDDDLHVYTSRVPVTDRILHYIQTTRYWCGRIVNHKQVQLFIVLLIGINAIMLGIGTFDFVTDNPHIDGAFELCDRIFLIVFTFELFMQFMYLGWRIILDGWLVFDLVIILTSWSFSEAQIVRAFRIFRALRLITRIKVMKNLVLGKMSCLVVCF